MNATTIATLPAKRPSAPAAALPVDLSHAPLLGILGVIVGAGIVTLTGRLLSLGLADLKGNVGISFDDGAWIGSAFNVDLMFIGPFTVFLGGLFGPRRILLTCATVFTVVTACLPLVHSYSLLIVLLVIAGLTSGNFLSPDSDLRSAQHSSALLALTLGLYATTIEGAVNFAPFALRILSRASFVGVDVLDIGHHHSVDDGVHLFRDTQVSRAETMGEAPSFAGFFYGSAGFALVYAAIDQGQRLDWWRSGLFTALFTAGTFLLLCALVRRLRSPNPLVDLPYLRKWNTVLLGFALFTFSFALLATILIIPQSLAVLGFDANQIGPAVLWTALPELVMAFIAAHLLNKGVDSRLLMAIGFATIAFACILNADFTSAWSAENYFRTELLMAVGQSVRFYRAGLFDPAASSSSLEVWIHHSEFSPSPRSSIRYGCLVERSALC